MIVFDSDYVAVNRGVLDEATHCCFSNGNPDHWQGFDFAAVERNLGELPDEPEPDAGAEELGSLLQWIWEDPGNLAAARERFTALAREALAIPGDTRAAVAFEKIARWCLTLGRGPYHPATPWRRFCAFSATVDPRLVAAKSYANLAKELRVTKACVSASARTFREHFAYFHHEWRSDEGRERMRQARLAQRLPGNERAPNHNLSKRSLRARQGNSPAHHDRAVLP